MIIPKIEEEARREAKQRDVVIDAALLLEMRLQELCDMTIGVIACEDTCIKRIIKRDCLEVEAAKARICAQKKNSFFQLNCDYCIQNEQRDDLEKQLEEIFNKQNLSNPTMLHICHKEASYLQFRKLLSYEQKIQHCYTLKPLDFQIEGKKTAEKDYDIILEALKLEKNQLYRPSQIHGKTIKKVENEIAGIYQKEFHDTDGLFTNQTRKILSLTYADCIPLYFYDPTKQVIGNVHSGWKGTYQEIAREAVRMLKKEYEVNPRDLICGIGPSIRRCCFEVGEDVKDLFEERWKDSPQLHHMIKKSKKLHHYFIDTVLMNKIILMQEGLKEENILDSGICTKCQARHLHSYRQEKEKSGRNTAMIALID